MRIRVGHLYPDYLNIYADRGNIAVLAERARVRGHELGVQAIGMGDAVPAVDLFVVVGAGGQAAQGQGSCRGDGHQLLAHLVLLPRQSGGQASSARHRVDPVVM